MIFAEHPKALLPTISICHFASIVLMFCAFLMVSSFYTSAPLDRIELLFYDWNEEIEAPPPEGDATCPPLLCGIPFAFGSDLLRARTFTSRSPPIARMIAHFPRQSLAWMVVA
jgi:hypothetical protein